ncbi:spermidine synthase [Catenovulum agarivorans DS-2]|uniref:Polyamine aminopropyltransferase n=1 Tax=Catenovulum agarivorans DS-2 TaxID=1328313 RepID=W7QG05_9ALTE|nr:polyamine aminopropyltransferase [Catenovulum agarivorans]EWH10831.1 spermidine synthase [Catenovulum agarivorans DS-2]
MTEQTTGRLKVRLVDGLLILIMAVLAGCGLIYEYLLSHYAGRVLGAVEHAIFATIGIMIVAMGFGAFAARKIKDAFSGFAWLELYICFIGASSILFIAAAIGFTFHLPQLISDTFNLPADVLPRGGWVEQLHQIARYLPYVSAACLGFFIGIEIPLIARVREALYQKHLTHNAGTVYGADYIGAGIGAALWIGWMMSLDINQAAVITASTNLLIGFLILLLFWQKIRWRLLLTACQLLMLAFVIVLSAYGQNWMNSFTDMLYRDQVVLQQQTQYQQIVLTERNLQLNNNPTQTSVLQLYLNGRLQFSSMDERIYHEMLIHPVMASAPKHDSVLLIGGGDGLALREIFKWPVHSVDMVELDPMMISLFKQPRQFLPIRLAKQVIELNANSLSDERLNLMYADAFNQVDQLVAQGRIYDVIVVDLPDPNHPDLNKLYTNHFYTRLQQLLNADGVLVVQSTSPYHAQDAFIAIGKTIADANFSAVEQYHQNVPSFGQWGWSVAVKQGLPVSERLKHSLAAQTMPVIKTQWLTWPIVLASFNFPQGFYKNYVNIKVNRLGSQQLFNYHDQAWRKQQGMVNLNSNQQISP